MEKKIMLIDEHKTYEVKSDNDLYILYNDFLSVYDDLIEEGKKIKEEDIEIVEEIRDFHSTVWKNVEAGIYTLKNFEKIAKKYI